MVAPFTRALGTHIRSADIIVVPDCKDPRLVRVTIRAYLNTLSNTKFGSNSRIYFGDGSDYVIPVTEAVIRPELGKNIAVAEVTRDHRYAQYGTYTVTYIERDRSSNIVNIFNSLDTPYVTFVKFTITEGQRCNLLPVLTVPPLDKACHKVAFLHNPGAFDPDGDSLSYQLSIPAAGLTELAIYTSPVDQRLYTGYATGNEDGTGPPTFGINAVTGLLTWDAPGLIGEYNIAFKIIEWRLDSASGVWSQISSTTRDMQIVVEDCFNGRPDLTVPPDGCVVAGVVIAQPVFAFDIENHPVKIELFSEVFQLPAGQSPAYYDPLPSGFRPSDPPAKTDFIWQTRMNHVRSQPYQVVAKVTDDPPNAPKLTNFRSWRIKVVAQAPVQKPPLYDVVRRHAVLKWAPYPSGPTKIQVYRRVGSFPPANDGCSTGVQKNSGYVLAGETSPTDTTFRDTNGGAGLSPGAVYCYRIVAWFGAPALTASLSSAEQCIGPIRADAPVITHVSVEKTDTVAGAVRVSWRMPFNISKEQFPPPYELEVYRSKGLFDNGTIMKAGRTRDTTFLDTGIDTERNPWNYRIVLYARPSYEPEFVPVDTSSFASSVRLAVAPSRGSISLTWYDSVPWSNIIQKRPWHLIYRATNTFRPNDFLLIDSVKVSDEGFSYTDSRVKDDAFYAYRVLSRGSYGNPAIALQENFSQFVKAYPKSDLRPCVPRVSVDLTDCDQYLMEDNCGATKFSNHLSWTLSGVSGCRKDISGFRVYDLSDPEKPVRLIHLRDTAYSHHDLKSFAACYGVSAVLLDGREGSVSTAVCNDNCPFFTLPNVFTPNGDDRNEVFSPDFRLITTGADAGRVGCPRFIKSARLTVVNRWGKEIHRSESRDFAASGIRWDGTDQQGRPVGTGLYYYVANVEFLVRDPSLKKRTYEGWVQLAR